MCDLLYAKGPHGPVRAVGKGDVAECYTCTKTVFGRREHKRLRNGTVHIVRAHFFHGPNSDCTGEGALHLAAKDALLHKEYTFVQPCLGCHKHMPLLIKGERRLEVAFQKYRLDVGVFDGDTLVGAIEVVNTHAMDDTKADALTFGGLAWCEVAAEDVLANDTLKCLRSAVLFCDACHTKHEELAAQKVEEGMRHARKQLEIRMRRRFVDSKLTELGIHESEWFHTDGTNPVFSEDTIDKLAPPTDADIARVQAWWDQFLRSLHRSPRLALDKVLEPLQLTDEQRRWLHKHIDKDFVDSNVFDLGTVERLAGPVDTSHADKKWDRFMKTLEKARVGGEYEEQQMNAKIATLLAGQPADVILTAQELVDADIVTFGKYNGMTLDQIYDRKRSYMVWLAQWHQYPVRGKLKDNPNLQSGPWKQKAREMLRGVCLVCFHETGEDWKNWCTSCYRQHR